jgi:uncharacterized protein YdaT
MPWTGAQFKAKHNHGLSTGQANKAARVATAMIERGVPEGEAIATGNARAKGAKMKKRGAISDKAAAKRGI